MGFNKIAEVIEKGVEYMDTHGWYQGYYYPKDEEQEAQGICSFKEGMPTCGLGSISFAQGRVSVYDNSNPGSSARSAAYALNNRAPGKSFPHFNDSVKDYSEVRDFMLGVAKDLRNNS